MTFFRITLLRSAIGLPKKYAGTLRALGLTKRMKTVYLPVNHEIAGQIFNIKELVDVQEVENKISNKTLKELRKPDPGFFVEQKAEKLEIMLGYDTTL
ncbi:putative ribosomal protein L30p/L7e [Elsinoe fawcettii]|nr:putative ribosomal protein L30p/L7e [Elsinoe fawcettii]